LKEQGLYDADKIKEVISDADSDNVRNKYYENLMVPRIDYICFYSLKSRD
jgi:hypothetical protein